MEKYIGKISFASWAKEEVAGFYFGSNELSDHMWLPVGTKGVAFATKEGIRIPVITEKGEYLVLPEYDGKAFTYDEKTGIATIKEQ